MSKLYDVTVFTPNNGPYGCVGGYVSSRLITANDEVEAERIALADEPAGANAYAKEVQAHLQDRTMLVAVFGSCPGTSDRE